MTAIDKFGGGDRLEGAPKHSLTMGGEIRGEISSDLG